MGDVRKFTSLDEVQLTDIAVRLAGELQTEDIVLLYGDLGAGKTTFARAAITWMLNQHDLLEDIPSPTFTLVQSYSLPNHDILHADLYRLSDPSELPELGLFDPDADQISFVEWPERLGIDQPADALEIHFTVDDDTRDLCFASRSSTWQRRIRGLYDQSR
ncbi:MAG: tRNA (adenosine(37)-N6)-threonylcarbamoyltransferase complex ATPase subunit type 1 TsaE [Pseudomonadota bacterium]